MAEVPEEHARQHHVDARGPSESPRNQEAHLCYNAESCDDPHHKGCRSAKNHERNRLPSVRLSEKVHVFKNLECDHPGTQDEQRRADIEPWASLKRGVERVQHRGVAAQYRERRHRRSQEHEAPPEPTDYEATLAWNGSIGNEERKAGNKERREDECHQHAVHREHAIVIEPRRCAKGACPRKPLKDAEDGAERDCSGGCIDVGDNEAIFANMF